ncbi:MAG TPA: hypothetical protein VM120_08115 [Bryobacteraceae bacterium]|nr:hypothetical protein [Bryobacteraceae bacterium]
MMLFALLLAATPAPIPISKTLRVPPADFKGLHVSIHNRPATLDLEYESQGGSGVRLVLMPQSEEGRFRAGRTPRQVASTDFDRSGHLKAYVGTPGEYSVVVDNRAEPKKTVVVQIRGVLTYDALSKEARYLSTQRRFLTIASGLLFFVTVAWVAGRRLWKATEPGA